MRGVHGLLCAAIASAALFARPATAGPKDADVVHVVAKGQTLGKIAKRYHVTVAALRDANDLHPGERIHPGLELVIPQEARGPFAPRSDGRRGVAKTAAAARGNDRGATRRRDGTPSDPNAYVSAPKKRGVVSIYRGTEHVDLHLVGRRGHLTPGALPALSQMLRFGPNGAKIAIDPRLASLVGLVSDHFGGRAIHVTSGYRPYSDHQYTKHSNHNVGRAVDFSVEGVPNTVVRDYCRTFRNAGVGYYPNSTFVHLDVRETKAYWVDYSHPGEPPSYDTPAARDTADESATEVETAAKGSAVTPQGASQPSDAMMGNPVGPDRARANDAEVGREKPASGTPGDPSAP